MEKRSKKPFKTGIAKHAPENEFFYECKDASCDITFGKVSTEDASRAKKDIANLFSSRFVATLAIEKKTVLLRKFRSTFY